ncbi:MAG: tetratricopeptide repeat protein [Treponema sp.]
MKKRSLFFIYILCGILSLSAQRKPDALKLFRDGRSLDERGRTDEAKDAYNASVAICLAELSQNPRNLDSYTVCTWSLLRLKRYDEVIKYCRQALNIAQDLRIIETAGEAYFYLGKYNLALQHLEQYVDSNQAGDRLGEAYFFIGEIYDKQRKYNKADIAYSMAVRFNSQRVLWWYRLAVAKENSMEKTSIQDKQNVISAYRYVLRLSPNYPGVQEKIRQLQAS